MRTYKTYKKRLRQYQDGSAGILTGQGAATEGGSSTPADAPMDWSYASKGTQFGVNMAGATLAAGGSALANKGMQYDVTTNDAPDKGKIIGGNMMNYGSQGAMAGLALGGPIGAAIGGPAGLLAGGIKSGFDIKNTNAAYNKDMFQYTSDNTARRGQQEFNNAMMNQNDRERMYGKRGGIVRYQDGTGYTTGTRDSLMAWDYSRRMAQFLAQDPSRTQESYDASYPVYQKAVDRLKGNVRGYKTDSFRTVNGKQVPMYPFPKSMEKRKYNDGTGYVEDYGVPTEMANAEIEQGEVFMTPDGNIGQVPETAPSHKQGGVDVNLPGGTMILGDVVERFTNKKFKKLGAVLAKLSKAADKVLEEGGATEMAERTAKRNKQNAFDGIQQLVALQEQQKAAEEQKKYKAFMRKGGVLPQYQGGGYTENFLQDYWPNVGYGNETTGPSTYQQPVSMMHNTQPTRQNSNPVYLNNANDGNENYYETNSNAKIDVIPMDINDFEAGLYDGMGSAGRGVTGRAANTEDKPFYGVNINNSTPYYDNNYRIDPRMAGKANPGILPIDPYQASRSKQNEHAAFNPHVGTGQAQVPNDNGLTIDLDTAYPGQLAQDAGMSQWKINQLQRRQDRAYKASKKQINPQTGLPMETPGSVGVGEAISKAAPTTTGSGSNTSNKQGDIRNLNNVDSTNVALGLASLAPIAYNAMLYAKGKPKQYDPKKYYNEYAPNIKRLLQNRYNPESQLRETDLTERTMQRNAKNTALTRGQLFGLNNASNLAGLRQRSAIWDNANRVNLDMDGREAQGLSQLGTQEANARQYAETMTERAAAQRQNALAMTAGQASQWAQNQQGMYNQRRNDDIRLSTLKNYSPNYEVYTDGNGVTYKFNKLTGATEAMNGQPGISTNNKTTGSYSFNKNRFMPGVGYVDANGNLITR